MDRLLDFIDMADMTRLHTTLALIGALLAVYVMAFTSYENEDISDPTWLQWFRRAGYTVVALAMVWSLTFQEGHQWHPWPPEILLMIGIIVMMAVRAVAIHLRIKRDGRRISVIRRDIRQR